MITFELLPKVVGELRTMLNYALARQEIADIHKDQLGEAVTPLIRYLGDEVNTLGEYAETPEGRKAIIQKLEEMSLVTLPFFAHLMETYPDAEPVHALGRLFGKLAKLSRRLDETMSLNKDEKLARMAESIYRFVGMTESGDNEEHHASALVLIESIKTVVGEKFVSFAKQIDDADEPTPLELVKSIAYLLKSTATKGRPLPVTEEHFKHMSDAISHSVAKRRYACLVMACGSYGYGFSLGLDSHGLPDVLISNPIPRVTGMLIEQVADEWLEHGYREGEIVLGEGSAQLRVFVRPLANLARLKTTYAPQLTMFYKMHPEHGSVEAPIVQAFTADDQGKYPFEEGYNQALMQRDFDELAAGNDHKGTVH